MRGKWALPALLSALLVAGCSTHDAPYHTPLALQGPAANADPPVTRAEWRRHLVRMQLGMFPDSGRLPADHVLEADAARAGLAAAETASVSVTWIGHATALVRMGGKWILTDPVLMPSIGPGPLALARLVPPVPGLDDLPPIDLILISHGDYDHLDLRSLRRLAVRNPEVLVLVPDGNARLAAPAGVRNVVELGWYERRSWDGLDIEAVPAIHGLRRPPEPRNGAHWGGWIVRHGDTSLYFAGDTGYGPVFADIARRAGPVDYALVPIGAYAPRRLEAPFHVDPEEAAGIARRVGARVALGIHWGTFPLSEEAPVEQRARFLAAADASLDTRTLRVGETIILVE